MRSIVCNVVFANLPATVFAQSSSCPGIHVKILNIRNSTGTLDCALFESPTDWGSQRNTMGFQTMQKPCSAPLRSLPPAFDTPEEPYIRRSACITEPRCLVLHNVSLNILRFHQILRPNKTFHTFLPLSFVNLTNYYQRMNPNFSFYFGCWCAICTTGKMISDV